MTNPLRLTLLFFLLPTLLFSQNEKPQKHYLGVDLGVDPFNVLKIAVESALDSDDDDEEYYQNDEDEETFGILSLGVYYKYKPFKKVDFDLGYKINFSSIGDLTYQSNNNKYEFISVADHIFYLRPNFSFRNIHEEGEGHISVSFEMGAMFTPGKLRLVSEDGNLIGNEKVRGSYLFYEFKAGYKYGLSNGAIGFNIAINNAPYKKATLEEIEKRGFTSNITGGPMVMLGISYEFGFERNKTKATQKKRERKNRAIIDKYEQDKLLF